MRRLPSLLLLLAFLLGAPQAGAESGDVRASAAQYAEGATQEGRLSALFLSDGEGDAGWSGELLHVLGHAASVEAVQVETRTVLGPGAAGVTQPLPDPQAVQSRVESHVFEAAGVRIVALQPDFQVHVQPVHVDDTLDFEAASDAGYYEPVDSLVIGAGRFEGGSGGPDNRARDSAAFWTTTFPTPHVLHDDQASRFASTLRGDVVLEIVGGSFELQDGSRSVVLESGVFEEPYAPTGLPSDMLLVSQRHVLLRLFLRDAEVEVALQGGAPIVYWASPEVTAVHSGATTMQGVTGTLRDGDSVISLRDQPYVLPAGATLQMQPADDALAVGIQPAGRTGPDPLAAVAVGVDRATAAVAVASLLVAVALGILWRRAGRPVLADVEAAIEAQQFRRGARLAKRILSRAPLQEDALLGRAIALSRGGRPARAIAEVRSFLARKPASDGSLHYVLGLALLDTGQRHAAEGALAEAARLTPALASDIGERLGRKPATPVLPAEPQAYA